MQITKEAIEAAGAAAYKFDLPGTLHAFDRIPEDMQEAYRGIALAALTAAYPFIRASKGEVKMNTCETCKFFRDDGDQIFLVGPCMNPLNDELIRDTSEPGESPRIRKAVYKQQKESCGEHAPREKDQPNA